VSINFFGIESQDIRWVEEQSESQTWSSCMSIRKRYEIDYRAIYLEDEKIDFKNNILFFWTTGLFKPPP
jgi:hypothetical protein